MSRNALRPHNGDSAPHKSCIEKSCTNRCCLRDDIFIPPSSSVVGSSPAVAKKKGTSTPAAAKGSHAKKRKSSPPTRESKGNPSRTKKGRSSTKKTKGPAYSRQVKQAVRDEANEEAKREAELDARIKRAVNKLKNLPDLPTKPTQQQPWPHILVNLAHTWNHWPVDFLVETVGGWTSMEPISQRRHSLARDTEHHTTNYNQYSSL